LEGIRKIRSIKEILLSRLVKFATQQVMTFLASKIPWLATGFLGGIVGFFVGKLVKVILYETSIGLVILYVSIDAKMNVAKVSGILKEIKNYDEEFTPEKVKEFDDRLAEAGHNLIKRSGV